MKIIYILLLFFSTVGHAISQSKLPFENSRYYYFTDAPGNYFFEFKDGDFTLYRPRGVPDADEGYKLPLPDSPDFFAEKIQGKYHLEKVHNIHELSIGKNKFILLYLNDVFLVLFDATKNEPYPKDVYYGINKTYYRSNGVLSNYINSCFNFVVSNFIDGKTKTGMLYEPTFSMIKYTNVWAVNLANEKFPWISFDISSEVSGLFLINGFIYPDNIKIYDDNCRAKTIRIEYDNYTEIVNLKDSPNPQLILLKNKASNCTVKITVLNTYAGLKYNDLVFSFIGCVHNVSKIIKQ